VIHQGRLRDWEPDVGDTTHIFSPYSKLFQAKAGYSGINSDEGELGKFVFSLHFMVNLGPFPPKREGGLYRQVFVGGEGDVAIEEVKQFVSSLREVLSADF
jgi:hypothetical protein